MDFPNMYRSHSSQETQNVGASLSAYLVSHWNHSHAQLLTLKGELGAGKTTFLQGFGRGLGWQGRLVSPTFIIARQYDLPNGILFFHLDLYRLQKESEVAALGFGEMLTNPNAIVAVEWPEKLGDTLRGDRYECVFESKSDDERLITIQYIP